MVSFLREDALDELSGGGLRLHGLSIYDDRDSLAHLSQLFSAWQKVAQVHLEHIRNPLKLMKWHFLSSAFKVGDGRA